MYIRTYIYTHTHSLLKLIYKSSRKPANTLGGKNLGMQLQKLLYSFAVKGSCAAGFQKCSSVPFCSQAIVK